MVDVDDVDAVVTTAVDVGVDASAVVVALEVGEAGVEAEDSGGIVLVVEDVEEEAAAVIKLVVKLLVDENAVLVEEELAVVLAELLVGTELVE